jgi:hypothetical protein
MRMKKRTADGKTYSVDTSRFAFDSHGRKPLTKEELAKAQAYRRTLVEPLMKEAAEIQTKRERLAQLAYQAWLDAKKQSDYNISWVELAERDREVFRRVAWSVRQAVIEETSGKECSHQVEGHCTVSGNRCTCPTRENPEAADRDDAKNAGRVVQCRVVGPCNGQCSCTVPHVWKPTCRKGPGCPGCQAVREEDSSE